MIKINRRRTLRTYQLEDSHVFRLCENKTGVDLDSMMKYLRLVFFLVTFVLIENIQKIYFSNMTSER